MRLPGSTFTVLATTSTGKITEILRYLYEIARYRISTDRYWPQDIGQENGAPYTGRKLGAGFCFFFGAHQIFDGDSNTQLPSPIITPLFG